MKKPIAGPTLANPFSRYPRSKPVGLFMSFHDVLLVKSTVSSQVDVLVQVATSLHSSLALVAGVWKVMLLDRPPMLSVSTPKEAASRLICPRFMGAKLHVSLDQGGVSPD